MSSSTLWKHYKKLSNAFYALMSDIIIGPIRWWYSCGINDYHLLTAYSIFVNKLFLENTVKCGESGCSNNPCL